MYNSNCKIQGIYMFGWVKLLKKNICIFLTILFLLLCSHTVYSKMHSQSNQDKFSKIPGTHSMGNGFYAEMQGNYKKAILIFSKEIESDNNNAIAYHQRGLCYYYLEDYKNALKDFDDAIKINPNYYDAFGNRSLTKIQLKDYNGALSDIEQILKIMPDNPKALKQKELILNKLNN